MCYPEILHHDYKMPDGDENDLINVWIYLGFVFFFYVNVLDVLY